MRTYERNGVHVDQCTECRGIFRDRGELEKLVDAENAWNASGAARDAPTPAAGPPVAAQPSQPGLGAMVGEVLQQARAAKSGHGRPYEQQYGKHPKRKKSFLEELLG